MHLPDLGSLLLLASAPKGRNKKILFCPFGAVIAARNLSGKFARGGLLTIAVLGLVLGAVEIAGAAETRPGGIGDQAAVQTPVDAKTLGFEEFLFVKRKPYSSDHYYTDINNGTAPDRFVPENGIYVYNVRTRSERPVVTAAGLPGGKGFIGKISLSFDAKRVLFDFRENPGAGFRIWEVGIDGKGLRQVSFPPPDEAEKVARWNRGWHTDDIHPNYLPDGRIVFSSTRSECTVLCGGSSHLVAPTLHRMAADGTNVEQLTRSPVSEFCPIALDDGRVMYHRWEYVDKGARVAKTIWSMNPDGSRPQELYGLADDDTTIYMYPMPLPGSHSRFVCVGTCHFPQGGCLGPILLVDYGMGMRERGPDPNEPGFVRGDTRYPVVNITPHVFIARRSEPGWHFLTADGNYVHDPEGRKGHLYATPYPVSDRRFLVSFKANPADHYKAVPNAYALYLIDTEGVHRKVHADAALSCWHPLALVPRAVPPVLEPVRDPRYAAANQALCVVENVYQGMDSVAPGEVKWLRVNEVVPRYWSTGRRWGTSLSSSSWKAALWPRVQWGVVPVEADGSAHFTVPTNRELFFQALDERGLAIQSMRSATYLQKGEHLVCHGCHEPKHRAPLPIDANLLALQRPASQIQADVDGSAPFSYPRLVQPVLDRHCVKCHAEHPDKPISLAREPIRNKWYASYNNLLPYAFIDYGNNLRTNPGQFGAKAAKLTAVLEKGHYDVKLSEEEFHRITLWLDCVSMFYGVYEKEGGEAQLQGMVARPTLE